jgi:GH25 family lysozyme M1 (1,4-beta-N-acetylmuramidase)
MVQIKEYGVDLSAYQPSDIGYMRKLRNAGATFAFVKLTEGTGYVNPNMVNQVINADAVGMKTAGYHFAQFGGNDTQAVKEGDFAVNTATGVLNKGSIIALDYEANASGSIAANTAAAKTFMRVIKNRGYVPMIYSYKPYFDAHLNLKDIISEFGECVWVAGYPAPGSATPNFNYFPSEPGVQIWQFDDNWKGLGVDGNVLIGKWLEGNTGQSSKPAVKPAKKEVKKPSPKKSAIQTFKDNGNKFTIYLPIKADEVRKVNGIWQMINYELAGGKKGFSWTNNGIPLAILDVVDAKGNLARNQNVVNPGMFLKFKNAYNHGTIDAYDSKTNGVGIKFGKYGMIWFDADTLLKL